MTLIPSVDRGLTANIVTFAVIFSDATSDGADQGPAAPKFAIIGSPRDGSVSENRCHDLPQAITTTGTLLIGGLAIGSLYPNSLDPTDRDWFKVTLEANVLYQFDVFHSRRVSGREGTTIGSARIHRILDSTGAAVTGMTYLQHSISGVTGDQTFFTPTAAGAYYLEVGAGSKRSLIFQLDQLVNWGTCTGHLPDPTRQVQGDHYTVVGAEDAIYRFDTWRHPNYDGWWEQVKGGSGKKRIFYCNRMFDRNDIRNGGIYYVRANVADEYTAGTDTAGAIAPGRTLQGYLYQNNGSNIDVDWVKISLTAGTTYRFTYQINSPGQTGPRITGLYDSGGTMVQGPVSGTYRTPFKRVTLEYTPTTEGNYYIGLGKTGASRDARWQLSVRN